MAPDGELRPYLEAEEVAALQVRRGSLTEVERVEIERHVVHTTKFLQEIPWGRRYADVPRIAAAHHEYLNGSGYPNRLPGKEIPVESRIMIRWSRSYCVIVFRMERPAKSRRGRSFVHR